MNKLVKAAIILFLFTASSAWCSEGSAGVAGEYLYLFSGGARGLALGLAQTALSGNSNLIYSNPASLADLWWREASFSYTPLFYGSILTNMSLGYPLSKNNVMGFSLVSLASGDAEKTNELGENIGTFKDRQIAVLACYARKLTDDLHLGVSAKFVSHEIDTYYDNGAGLDLGAIYFVSPVHCWSLNLINIMPVKLKDDEFPFAAKIGFRHSLVNKELYLTTDILARKNSNSLYYGLEYVYREWLNLRGGYNEKQISCGFGVPVKHIDLDYAFVYHQLGYLHSITVNMRFGYLYTEAEVKVQKSMEDLEAEKKAFLEQKDLEEENRKKENARLALQTKLTLKFLKASHLYQEDKNEEAKDILEEVLKEDQYFQDARQLYNEIKTKLDKKTIEIRYKDAMQMYERGMFEDSFKVVEYILSIDSQHQNTLILKILVQAQLLLKDKKYNDAKNELIEILKIDPQNNEAMQLLKRIQTIIEINK